MRLTVCGVVALLAVLTSFPAGAQEPSLPPLPVDPEPATSPSPVEAPASAPSVEAPAQEASSPAQEATTPAAEADAVPDAATQEDERRFRHGALQAGATTTGMLVGGVTLALGGAVALAVLTVAFGIPAFGIYAIVMVPFLLAVGLPVVAMAGGLLGAGLGFLAVPLFYPPYDAPGVLRLPRNVLTLSPLHLLRGHFSLEYERALSDHFTLFVAPFFDRGLDAVTQIGDDARPYVGLTAGLRWFVWGQAPRGAYLSPEVLVGDGEGGSRATAALVLGHQWLIFRHAALNVGLGGGYDFIKAVPTLVLRTNLGAAF